MTTTHNAPFNAIIIAVTALAIAVIGHVLSPDHAASSKRLPMTMTLLRAA